MIMTKNNISFDVNELTSFKNWWTTYFSDWEEDHFKIISKYADKEKSFVDIGAWIGPISMYASKVFKKVYSIEPDPIAFKELVANIELNQMDNVELFHKALCYSDSELFIGNFQQNLGRSCSKIFTQDELNEAQKGNARLSMAEKITFEELGASDIGMMKMDIEGGEFELVPQLIEKGIINKDIPLSLSVHPKEGNVNLLLETLKPIYKNQELFMRDSYLLSN